MTRATPYDTFDIATFQLIQGINDTSKSNIQPSMSDSLEWVAFVRNSSGMWDDNDLYIAHKGIYTIVFNPVETQISSSLYPNPSTELIHINYKLNSSVKLSISIFSNAGLKVFEDELEPFEGYIKLYVSQWNNGLYLYLITASGSGKHKISTGKFIVQH
jgi:hypothetical protein